MDFSTNYNFYDLEPMALNIVSKPNRPAKKVAGPLLPTQIMAEFFGLAKRSIISRNVMDIFQRS